MKYIFRGYEVFEYDQNRKEVRQNKIHQIIPAFDFCVFIPEDYKLLSEFFNKAYRHSIGETVLLKDIVVH